MEKIFNLKSKDGKNIRSIHTTDKRKNSSVVVFIHGLTGHPNEHIYYNAARSFPSKGLDTFRFALYWWEKNNRRLEECSILTHAQDLNKVLQHLRPQYKSVTVVGHSLGSPAILRADNNLFDRVVLWDPSYLEKGIRHELKEITVNKTKYWLSHDQFSYLLSREMINEWEWFNGVNELTLISELDKPLAIIAADKGILKKGSRAYDKAHRGDKKLTLIENATHCFDEEGTETVLLKETLEWIASQIKKK